jgi:hypothetical protein
MGRASFAEEASNPDTPSSGYVSLYFLDSSSGIIKTKDDAGVVRTVIFAETENVFTAKQTIDVSDTAALLVEDDGVNDDVLVVDTTLPGVGIGGAPGREFHIQSNSPSIILEETDAAADNKVWEINVGSERLAFFVRDDAISAVQTFILVDRTAVSVDSIRFDVGNVGVGVGAAPSAKLHIDQASASGAIPALKLDQGDTSEQCIQFSSDGADQDINLYTVDVTGTPTVTWDEGADAFVQNKGLSITSGSLVIPQDIIHSGDTDTYHRFSSDKQSFFCGAQQMLELTEAGQDEILLGITPSGTDIDINFNGDAFIEGSSHDMSIGVSGLVPSAQLHIDQASPTGAQPVLLLDQADVSEEFVRYIGTAAVATLTNSIVAEADVTTATRAGFIRVYVQDDGNQITDQAYYMPLFTLA